MHSPDPSYEYAVPITVYGSKTADQGGSQGTPAGIVLASPFGSAACEVALQLVNVEAAGTIAISPDGVPPAVAMTNDGGVNGYLLKTTAAASYCPALCFTPLLNGRVYVSLNITGGNASLTFVFRRHRGHAPEFQPMFHARNPEDEQLVNQARARAMATLTEPEQVRTRYDR